MPTWLFPLYVLEISHIQYILNIFTGPPSHTPCSFSVFSSCILQSRNLWVIPYPSSLFTKSNSISIFTSSIPLNLRLPSFLTWIPASLFDPFLISYSVARLVFLNFKYHHIIFLPKYSMVSHVHGIKLKNPCLIKI